MKKHIMVIDPGAKHPEHDTFNQLVLRNRSAACFTYHLPSMFGFESIYEVAESADAVIVLGSGASVYDGQAWQEELVKFLRKVAVEQQLPTLGVCYGHQLIAHMFGAKIEFAETDRRKFTGFRKMFGKSPGQSDDTAFEIVVSHREVVSDVPSGFHVTLRSEAFAIEGLKDTKRPIYTVSGHPEATKEFLRLQGIEFQVGDDIRLAEAHLYIDDFVKTVAESST
ncbi:hypothetical protein N9D31_01980 [Oligoflexaceae bacterium]|nr:hypothetical protein [Oligoflexaceae bacterium]